MTAADAFGNVVATTQTINNLFGAKILIPGLGTIPNNYMNLYDPRPGHALSLAPGKRVTTSMSPMMALRDGKLVYALGLPGGKRIFPSAMQALINLIDHGMSLQEAVEAPRVWTEGNALEVELAVPESVRAKLTSMGHKVQVMPTVAGGMNAIEFHDDGRMSGAACWRADGTPIGDRRRAGARRREVCVGASRRCIKDRHTREGGYPVRRGLSALLRTSLEYWSPATAVRNSRTTAGEDGLTYFLTQITRTTDAFASGDPPAALTPLALRKSRTVSDVTSTACAAGAPFAGPATCTGFNSAMPANLPSPSSAAAPEKPIAGAGVSATSLPPPSWATEALTLLTRRAAALVLRIGNAGEVERSFRGGVGEIDRLQPARAIDAQQREIVLLVLGDAIGIAEACDRDREAAIGDLAVGDDRAVLADDDAGAVFHGLARRWSRHLRRGRKRIERARHRDHDRLHGIFGRLIVEDGEDADLVALEGAAQIEFLHALQAGQHEEVRLDHGVVDLASRLLLLALGEFCRNGAGFLAPRQLDLDRAGRRGPFGAVGVAGLLRHQPGGDAEPHAGAGIGLRSSSRRFPAFSWRCRRAMPRSCGLSTPVGLPPRPFWNSLMALTMRSLTSPVIAPLYWPTQARSDCSASRSACPIAFAVSSGFCSAGRTGTVVTGFGLAPAVEGGVICACARSRERKNRGRDHQCCRKHRSHDKSGRIPEWNSGSDH